MANFHKDYMTADRLKAVLKKVPDDTPVYYQRIEDVYFEKHGWNRSVINVQNDMGPSPDQYTQAFNVWYDSHHKALFITAHY